MKNNTLDKNKKEFPQIDVLQGSLILIDMLYSQKLINKKTYDNIQNKYNNKQIEK